MAKSIIDRLSTTTKRARKAKGKKRTGNKAAKAPRKIANPLSFLHMERDAYAHDAPAEYVYVRFYDAEGKRLVGSLREDDQAAQELRAAFKSDACKSVGATGRVSKLRWSPQRGAWKGRRDLFPQSVLDHCDNVQEMVEGGEIELCN